jgi:hypothetical protein
MKPATFLAITAVVALSVVRTASAQTSTQTVTFQVTAVNQISVAGSPSLLINAAAAGSAPTSVTSAGNTWSVTTNQTASVTASISTTMPTGLTLSANLTAPAGATSTGLTALGTVAVSVVTGITKLNSAALGLTYQLDATAAAGVVTSGTRVVTYTITGAM